MREHSVMLFSCIFTIPATAIKQLKKVPVPVQEERTVRRLVRYRRTDQIRKYIKKNGSQISVREDSYKYEQGEAKMNPEVLVLD